MSEPRTGRSARPADASRGRGASLAQPISAGILACLVGFASTFAVVLQGYIVVGASREEAASGLLSTLVLTGAVALVMSLRLRIPVAIAWSTPGSALLLASHPPVGGYPVAAGAFMTASALVVAAGLSRRFGRAVAAIPLSLASAMLAGILLDLCLAPVRAVAALPTTALPIVLVWAMAWRFARPYAVPLAVVVAAAMIMATTPMPPGGLAELAPHPVLIVPGFSVDALLGIAVPLFIVTMASQNVPGLAVMRANGYAPPIGPVFVATGAASVANAFFGGHLVNLAAITAAICAGPDADPDPSRRWIAAATSGVGYIVLGLGATFAAALVATSPPLLIQAVAGLALLGSLAGSLQTALAKEDERVPAIVTFVVVASGVSFWGVGSALWGLLAGGTMLLLTRIGRTG